MEELQVNAEITKGAIRTNFQEVKAWLAEELSHYELCNFTGDDVVKQLKAGRTKLNRLSSALRERKKTIRMAFMEPYEQFCLAADDLLAMIQESCDTLDGRIKEYECQEKELRKKEIATFYQQELGKAEITADLWSQIFDAKWLNKSCSKKTWKDAITGAVQSYLQNLDILSQLAEKEDFPEAKALFERNLNLQEALAYVTKRKTEREMLARERIRIAAEEQAKARMFIHTETQQIKEEAEKYAGEREEAARREEQTKAREEMLQKQREMEQRAYAQARRQTMAMPETGQFVSYPQDREMRQSMADNWEQRPYGMPGYIQGNPMQAACQATTQRMPSASEELCTFSVYKVHQAQICQFLTQHGIGYHLQ